MFVRLLWTYCCFACNSNRLTSHKRGLLRWLRRQRGLLTSRPEFNSQGAHLWKRVSTNSHKLSFDLHVWAYDQTKKVIFKKNYFKSRGTEHCYNRWSLNRELKRDLPPSASCGLGCKASSHHIASARPHNWPPKISFRTRQWTTERTLSVWNSLGLISSTEKKNRAGRWPGSYRCSLLLHKTWV